MGENKTSLPVKICDLLNSELLNVRKDLVKTGHGDLFMLEIIKGCEIVDVRFNTDEVYIQFRNGDVLRG